MFQQQSITHSLYVDNQSVENTQLIPLQVINDHTVTIPPITTTEVTVITVTTPTVLPGTTLTITQSGTIITSIQPPVTSIVTSIVTQIITIVGPTQTITAPGNIITVTTSTVLPGTTLTITQSGTTITSIQPPVTSIVTQIITIVGPTQTITAPGNIITVTTSTVLPGTTLTITQSGTTITSIQPPVTSIITQIITIVGPTQTVSGPGSTETITESSVVTCPAPTNSAPVTPQDTGPNALWGCSPGFVCSPPKPDSCTVFAQPPSYDYLCDASFCIPSPPFTPVVWPDHETSFYPPTQGYFNLPPPAFGLDYGIFAETVVNGVATGDWSSQASITHFPPAATAAAKKVRHLPPQARALPAPLQKRDSTIVPAVCYAVCNNCYIEAQKVGKSPALCSSGSAFESELSACESCVQANGDSTKATLQTYVSPEFAPFITFCNAQPPAQPIVESTSIQVNTPPAVTHSVVVATEQAPTPTISVGVTRTNTPTPSPSPATPPSSPSSTSSQPFSQTSTNLGASTSAPSQIQPGSNAGNHLNPSMAFAVFIAGMLALALAL
jgi:hypothetical protein